MQARGGWRRHVPATCNPSLCVEAQLPTRIASSALVPFLLDAAIQGRPPPRHPPPPPHSSDCNIYGQITAEMAGAWSQLVDLEMPGNLLSGALPSNWAGSLQTFDLS